MLGPTLRPSGVRLWDSHRTKLSLVAVRRRAPDPSVLLLGTDPEVLTRQATASEGSSEASGTKPEVAQMEPYLLLTVRLVSVQTEVA